MPEGTPTEPAPLPAEPFPKVDGSIGNASLGIGFAIGKIAGALAGDNGMRLLALCVVASFTWVGTWGITKYTEMQSEMNALQSRVGEDRVEREKTESARREVEYNRREVEQRNWIAQEREKERQSHKDNLSYLAREFATEQEKNRAMLFKLATERRPPGEIP